MKQPRFTLLHTAGTMFTTRHAAIGTYNNGKLKIQLTYRLFYSIFVQKLLQPLFMRGKSQNQTAGVRLSVIDRGLPTIHPINESPRHVDVANLGEFVNHSKLQQNFTDGD
jgi:hypothetical protein